MSKTAVFAISIPTDDDGQVLLKCPVRNDLFKVDGSVYGDDSVFEIRKRKIIPRVSSRP